MSPGTECPVCGEHLPGPDPRRTGRKPGYCSNACKAKAYRARQRSGEHVSAADPALLSSAGDRYVRTTGIHQRISDLTTALADTASGQQALFAPPRTVRRMRPADTAAALHLLIAELAFVHDPPLVTAAELGLFAGSAIAFAVGATILVWAGPGGADGEGGSAPVEDGPHITW